MYSKKTKKVFSILLTFALLLGFGISNIQAAPGDVLDPNHAVSLTIQKYLTPVAPSVPGDGVTAPGAGMKPGSGVDFTLYKLTGVDENTIVEDDTTYAVDAGFMPLTGTTDSNGVITWTTKDNGLVQGFYLLVETFSPYDGTKSAANPEGILAAIAASTIVTLPFANSTEYLYDVKVFPKNVGDANKKTVNNANNVYKPGDTLEWTLETVINYQKVQSYKITDQLDSRLDYNGVTVSMVTPAGITPVPLSAGTDYTVTPASPTADGPEVTVTLTAAGLAKVKDNKAYAIRTVVTTTINMSAFSLDDDGNIIFNNAEITFDNGKGSEETVNIPTSAHVTLASLTLDKINREGDKLEGAEFRIAATEAKALAGNFLKDSSGNELVLTTDRNGYAFVSGIPYEEFTTDAAGETVSVTIYLVETKAPDGYDLPLKQSLLGGVQPAVFKTTLTQGASTTITDPLTGDEITYTPFTSGVTITNAKGFELPLTGGSGTIIFTAAGLILILGATFILFRTRKSATGK